jgi:hypothetical protein
MPNDKEEVPNSVTEAAIQESEDIRKGIIKKKKYCSVDELIKDLENEEG